MVGSQLGHEAPSWVQGDSALPAKDKTSCPGGISGTLVTLDPVVD
jgi:hypothetical protein